MSGWRVKPWGWYWLLCVIVCWLSIAAMQDLQDRGDQASLLGVLAVGCAVGAALGAVYCMFKAIKELSE